MKESLLNFFGTGMLVVPAILAIGTRSLDAVAMSLFVLLILQLGALVFRADDPIGDKLKADETREREEKPPQ